jgi:hypothetical protein
MCDTRHVTEPTPEGSQVTPTWTNQSEHLAYANALTISGGPFDLTLVFGQQDAPIPAEPSSPVRETVRVTMSWGHAKSMIPLLAKIVSEYEQRFGEIPAPGFGESWKT